MTSPANVFVVVPPEGKLPTGYAALINDDGTPWSPGGGVQPGDLADVAMSGAYSDLTGTPTLGSAAAANAGDFATAAQGSTADSAVQPGDLPAFGTAASADVGDFLANPTGASPAYSVEPADLAAALVRAGLMQAGG